MSLKEAISNHLQTLPIVSTNCGTRVYSKRVKKDQISYPYIVYSIDGYENKLKQFQGNHGYKGNKVVIDVVGDYQNEDLVDEIGDAIQKSLGGFQGTLGTVWTGYIGIVYVENGYDELNDACICRIGLLFKEIY